MYNSVDNMSSVQQYIKFAPYYLNKNILHHHKHNDGTFYVEKDCKGIYFIQMRSRMKHKNKNHPKLKNSNIKYKQERRIYLLLIYKNTYKLPNFTSSPQLPQCISKTLSQKQMK